MVVPKYKKGVILLETMYQEYMIVESYDYHYDVYTLTPLKNEGWTYSTFSRQYVENTAHFVPKKVTLTPLWRLLNGYE